MSFHPDIITWSQQRPAWQQDALRRLADQRELTDTDIDELVILSKAEYGLGSATPPTAKPLVPSTNGADNGSKSAVLLRSIRELRNVNALRPDQELTVAPTGLTVVYGDNGAGKSGYVRVIKQLCRARGAKDAIIPNIFQSNDQPSSASLTFSLGDEVQPPVEWTPQCVAPEWLDEISIFDSQCAAVYVTAENPVAYLPHGMDLFPRLASTIDLVRSRLEGDLADIERRRDTWSDFELGTRVRELLGNLTLPTVSAELDKLAALSEADKVDLAALRAKDKRFKSENPKGRAEALRLCAKRVGAAQHRLAELRRQLTDSSLATVREMQEALTAAQDAARLASNGVFTSTPVPGVGERSWKILWKAARDYATSLPAPFSEFPPAEGDLCILCQQPVLADAASRLQAFNSYIKGEAEKAILTATQNLDEKRQALLGLRPGDIADEHLIDEIAILDADLKVLLVECVAALSNRQSAACAATTAEAWEGVQSLPVLIDDRFDAVLAGLERDASDFDRASNHEEHIRVENELRELAAREQLAGERQRVAEAVDRERDIAKLRKCANSASTTSVTNKNKEMLSQVITSQLKAEFAAELKALRLTHIPIEVEATRGQKGKALHALRLDPASTKTSVSADKILSEGEHRCIALAAFFAEVSLQESASMLVFDDPVSSLDHGRRQYVARRLVDLSLKRPVLVFTHDLVFLWMLQSEAAIASLPLAPRLFRRDATRAGQISDDWPWDGQKVSARLGNLRTDLAQLKKLASSDRAKYEPELRLFYGRLRDTWERAVEETLLQNGVRRFGKEIKTQSLTKLHRLTEDHTNRLYKGMTKTSDWIPGHDHSPELALPLPEPDEAEQDFQDLATWVGDIKALYK